MNFLAVLLLGIVPPELPVREHIETIELNCYYDEQANLVFSQYLFRKYNPHTNQNEIVDWRLVKNPVNMPAQGKLTFYDTQSNALRHITYDHAYQTFTQYDPELIERETLPKELRRELSSGRRK